MPTADIIRVRGERIQEKRGETREVGSSQDTSNGQAGEERKDNPKCVRAAGVANEKRKG